MLSKITVHAINGLIEIAIFYETALAEDSRWSRTGLIIKKHFWQNKRLTIIISLIQVINVSLVDLTLIKK